MSENDQKKYIYAFDKRIQKKKTRLNQRESGRQTATISLNLKHGHADN